MSSATLLLFMFQVWKYWLSPFASMCGPTWRAASPPVAAFSTLITSAPRSASSIERVGAGAELLEGEDAHAFERLHAPALRFIHCLRDDQALHLVGAFADAGERRVAIEPLDVVFLRIAVGAVDAQRLGRVLERGLGGEILRHAGFHVAALAAVEGRGGIERQQPRGAGARRHLAELERDRLMLGDRLAEGVAHLRVVGREPQRAFGDADAARRDVDAPELEPAGRLIEALALDLADQVIGRNAIVLEDQLGGIDRLVAELLELAADAEARPASAR